MSWSRRGWWRRRCVVAAVVSVDPLVDALVSLEPPELLESLVSVDPPEPLSKRSCRPRRWCRSSRPSRSSTRRLKRSYPLDALVSLEPLVAPPLEALVSTEALVELLVPPDVLVSTEAPVEPRPARSADVDRGAYRAAGVDRRGRAGRRGARVQSLGDTRKDAAEQTGGGARSPGTTGPIAEGAWPLTQKPAIAERPIRVLHHRPPRTGQAFLAFPFSCVYPRRGERRRKGGRAGESKLAHSAW